ncbi:MAG TPA: hypothetical protein VFF12_16155, partial [Myxococcaceae bacterium]|nr:hypothetical protein [Myxococcaceae bacterium]
MSATLSLPGPSAVMATASRAPQLFGAVRRGEDLGFWRRMLRLLPLALALHLVAFAVLLTVRPAPRPLPEEPPRVVFLRALPQARAPAAGAEQARAHPSPQKARPVTHRREIRPPQVLPKELPPEQPPAETVTAADASTAVATATASSSGPEASPHGGSGLGSTGDAPVGVGEITRPPAILFSPRPQYPSAA